MPHDIVNGHVGHNHSHDHLHSHLPPEDEAAELQVLYTLGASEITGLGDEAGSAARGKPLTDPVPAAPPTRRILPAFVAE